MNEREAFWFEHQRRRWMRPVALHAPTWTGKRGRWMPENDAALEAEQQRRETASTLKEIYELKSAITKLRSDLAFERFKRAYVRWARAEELRHKAGFHLDQPRVSAGNPDGGQWTSGGSNAGRNDPRVISDATPDNLWKPDAQYAENATQRRYSVNLEEEDSRGGHTIEKHVSKTDEELLGVLRRNYYVGVFSYRFQDAEGSFTSAESANDLVNRVLENNKATVDLVASGGKGEAMFEQRFGYVTGKEAFRPDVYAEPYMRNTYAVRVVIRHDPSSERGYGVLTAFPVNQNPRSR